MRLLKEVVAVCASLAIDVSFHDVHGLLIQLEDYLQSSDDERVEAKALLMFLHHIDPVRRSDEIHA